MQEGGRTRNWGQLYWSRVHVRGSTSVSEEDPLELSLSESDMEDEPVFETVAGKRRNVFRIRGTKQQQEKMSVIYSYNL